jgi:hypothetical protein
MTRRLSDSSFRYGIALLEGRSDRARYGTDAGQVRRYRQGQARNNAVSRVAMAVLDHYTTSPWLRVFYVGFALQADRTCRKYFSRTRENQLRAIVNRWEAMGLDRAILEKLSVETAALSMPGRAAGERN